MQNRIVETECATCGEPMEIDLSDDPGADVWSVEQQDHYCCWTCEQEAM